MTARRRHFRFTQLTLLAAVGVALFAVWPQNPRPAAGQATPSQPGTATMPAWGESPKTTPTATQTGLKPPATVPWKSTSATPFSDKPFVMSLAQDKSGAIWIGTEGEGVWRYDASLPADQRWRKYTTIDGLGDDNGYALASDRLGRIWVGHLNHGVSVFNGQKWQNYEVVGGLSRPDTLSGPLGERIFAIAVCPTDGDVWIASNAGLARYREKKDEWTYYTRAEGLPSDQANAMAFDKDGNIFVGTQCDGVAMADSKDDYKAWRVAKGPDAMPCDPAGEGLPTNLINDVLVAQDGTVYGGTACGLAWSADHGKSWRYARGKDWAAKTKGSIAGPPKGWNETTGTGQMVAQVPWSQFESPSTSPASPVAQVPWASPSTQPSSTAPSQFMASAGAFLAEDFVTSLSQEPGSGDLWIGYRSQGSEKWDLRHGKTMRSEAPKNFVNCILPIDNPAHDAVIGTYGDGQLKLPASNIAHMSQGDLHSALPKGAAPPTIETLTDFVESAGLSNGVTCRYLGTDWATQGDWVGRYGRQSGVLCAANSPFDHVLTYDQDIQIKSTLVASPTQGDQVRNWLRERSTDAPQSLWDPFVGARRQAEWDDHGEAVAREKEGPDLRVRATLPDDGIYRLSFYFVNVNRQAEGDRTRDYSATLTAIPNGSTIDKKPAASCVCRLQNFYGGVYQQFLVRGSADYDLVVHKNASLNTICSGVFVDKVGGEAGHYDALPLMLMGNLRYDVPSFPDLKKASEAVAKIAQLWEKLEGKSVGAGISGSRQTAILLYRLAQASQAPEQLLSRWRWCIPVWSADDRRTWTSTMNRAWEANLKLNPQFAGSSAKKGNTP